MLYPGLANGILFVSHATGYCGKRQKDILETKINENCSRSIISQTRLSSLAMISIENEHTKKFDLSLSMRNP